MIDESNDIYRIFQRYSAIRIPAAWIAVTSSFNLMQSHCTFTLACRIEIRNYFYYYL